MMPMYPIIARAVLDGEVVGYEIEGEQEFASKKPPSDDFRKKIIDIRKNIRLLAG